MLRSAHQPTYHQTFCPKRVMTSVMAVLLMVFVFILPAKAVLASSLSEQFVTSKTFKPGLLVSKSQTSGGDLELATLNNSGYLLGVVTTSEASAVNLEKNGARTSVALSGIVATYVTDANGEIKKGSLIGPSWLDGVGMAVHPEETGKVVGIAQEDFNATTAKDFSDVETPSGNRTVKVGSIAVRLTDPPAQHVVASQTGVSGFTSKLAGKQVSFTRVVSAMLIFSLSLVVCAIFIRNAIKNSFISIGRNPMASHSIYKGLLQVSLVSVGVILMGTAAAYAVIVVG